ncbi:MAG: 3-dehydroquinate synthase [Candidatus Sumerlaeota bacterium]|nr:3-dehydroquinate synthase [Candidatus Sumerlaeota bacterium]
MVRTSEGVDHVQVELAERSYDILIGCRLFDSIAGLVREAVDGRKVMLAYDSAVASPWAKLLLKNLSEAGFEVLAHEVPSGEKSKNTETMVDFWNAMAEAEFTRDSGIVALGGGVVGDLAGFAAASFLRGIAFVQIPTTLLAMVDSSVGGKTGINLEAGKNLVGAFWQPRLVVADIDCLKTLPEPERNSGMAEVIKYGVIRDAGFFEFLEESMESVFDPAESANLRRMIKRSVEIKAEVVGADEREGGLRRILNFGHTIGHAIEAEGEYGTLRHGEAISIGMVAASRLALLRGESDGWTDKEHERLVRLFEKANLPTRLQEGYTVEGLIDRTRVDKKAKNGKVRYILPVRMGEVETVRDVTDEMVARVLTELGASRG